MKTLNKKTKKNCYRGVGGGSEKLSAAGPLNASYIADPKSYKCLILINF